MKTDDFDFHLPEERIAQNPVEPRDHSRLLRLNRKENSLTHHQFFNLVDILSDDDVLVMNDTRVVSARVYGRVEGMAGDTAEVLLLREVDEGVYRAMVKPGKRFKEGKRVFLGDTISHIIGIEEEGTRLLKFEGGSEAVNKLLKDHGHTPLPPYIKHSTAKPEQYQTVYAKEGKSVAAPTAGLHFTPELLAKLEAKGVQLEYVTLDVERGTFLGVSAEDIKDHTMHHESCKLNEDVAARLNEAKAAGRRIIAVGTTSVRVLESAATEKGKLSPYRQSTNIFIYPGYEWKFVDALITNFHLPKSTLIMLVSALAGREFTLEAYKTAVEEEYRFYSFGDAMFIE